MSDAKIATVLGIGPGLGAAAARRFAKEGYAVALMARGEDKLAPVHQEIEGLGGQALSVPCDATDPTSVQQAFARVRHELGDPEVFVYNAGAFKMGGLLELDAETFEHCWRANCYGGFLASQQVLPKMLERGRGTILLTGATASTRGGARFSALAVGKFGLRALAQSMAREFGPQGVHVAHVIIDGQILAPRTREMFPGRDEHTFLSPDSIAETYWSLHQQDRTCWTHEIDLRPAVEKF
jgi:NAD(P)-dependent dehydrogenase (short-subunit alcohol dehydrogenase family)